MDLIPVPKLIARLLDSYGRVARPVWHAPAMWLRHSHVTLAWKVLGCPHLVVPDSSCGEMGWMSRMPLSEHPDTEGFSHHTSGQYLMTVCGVLSMPWAMYSWPMCSQKLAQPVFLSVGISNSQLLFVWLRPSSIYSPGRLLLSFQLPFSHAHVHFGHCRQWCPDRLRPPSNNGGRNMCGTQSVPLELALGTGTGSCRRLGLSGSWQNDKLIIPQC